MRRLLLLAIATLGLGALGCSIVSETVVNDDGSGHQVVRMVIDGALLEGFGVPLDEFRAEMGSAEEMAALAATLPPGVSLEVIDGDEGIGFQVRIEFGPTDDVAASLEALAASIGDDFADILPFTTGTEAEPLTLRREGDEWVFRADSAGADSDMLGDLTGDPSAAAFAGLFANQMTMTMRVRLPGRLLSHNADIVEADGTLVWDLNLLEGETLEARSTLASEGGFPVGGVAATGVGAVVIAGILGFALLQRRRPPAPTPE